MRRTASNEKFETKTAAFFEQRALKVTGKEKLLVALEMSRYLTLARQHGITFEELRKAGFKFATV